MTLSASAQVIFSRYSHWFEDTSAFQGDVNTVHLHLDTTSNDEELVIVWPQTKGSIKIQLDINQYFDQRQNTAHRGPFYQALGKKTHSLLDATAGWGADSRLMSAWGFRVNATERHPLLAMMHHHVLKLTARNAADNNKLNLPTIEFRDATDYLTSVAVAPDCVYLDPMFPPKRKRSAVSNKYMQLAQAIIGPDEDSEAVLKLCQSIGVKRVVVKRPDHASPLFGTPEMTFSAKLVHYDVYINH